MPRADLFDRIVTLTAAARVFAPEDFTALCRTAPPREASANLTALPCYLWANRGQGSMVVWIPYG